MANTQIDEARMHTHRKMLGGAKIALKRVQAERKMYGATPTNGLAFWESSALYLALEQAENHLKARIFDLEEELTPERISH
jgi:hypothetical protein